MKAQTQFIDVAQIDTRALPERLFPGTQRFRITIIKDAHDAIWQRAKESCIPTSQNNRPPEIGGVLLGNVYKDSQGPFLEVEAAIAAEHTQETGTQVVFTEETWAHFNRIRTEQYPQLRVVGWYHTHPGTGLALTETERLFHQNCFQQPWTAAFVVDPLIEMDGFFLWDTGEPRIVSEYWVGQERRGRRAPAARSAVQHTPPARIERNSKAMRASFALTTLLLFLSLMYMLGYIHRREVQHTQTENTILQALEEQKGRLQSLTLLAQGLERTRQEAKANGLETVKTEVNQGPQK